MSNPDTLMDKVYRETFRPGTVMSTRPTELRALVQGARKFTMDRGMSAMLADLAITAFQKYPKRRQETADKLRRMSRLPHRVTWVEHDARARRHRALELYPDIRGGDGGALAKEDEVTPRLGWLLQQHDEVDCAFKATLFAQVDNSAVMYPFSWTWSSEDQEIPWPKLTLPNGEVLGDKMAVGVDNYSSQYAGTTDNVLSPYNDLTDERSLRVIVKMLTESVGELRTVWAFLSTINELPVKGADVFAAKGFVARGRYRRFLDHKIIHLTVPTTRYQRLALRAVAGARRRAHEVRGHWRRDWRNEGGRLWIAEHQRGDASLGFVTHNYEVHQDQ